MLPNDPMCNLLRQSDTIWRLIRTFLTILSLSLFLPFLCLLKITRLLCRKPAKKSRKTNTVLYYRMLTFLLEFLIPSNRLRWPVYQKSILRYKDALPLFRHQYHRAKLDNCDRNYLPADINHKHN